MKPRFDQLRLVTMAALVMAVSGCRYVLGLDDPPEGSYASECIRDRDCTAGNICEAYRCVRDCREGGCPSVDAPNEANPADAHPDGNRAPDRIAQPYAEDASDRDAQRDGPDPDTSEGLPPIVVTVQPPILCPTMSYSIPAQARGGAPAYRWSLDGDQSYFVLQQTEGDNIDIGFTPSRPGDYPLDVTVHDSAGAETNQSSTLTVQTPPELVNPILPVGCVGQPYSEKLLATGGGTGPATWTLITPAPVELNNGTVSTVPRTAGVLTFEVTVKNGACTSAPLRVSVPVSAAGSSDCPDLEITPDAIPAPCLDNRYEYTGFGVRGGKAPYTWEVVSPPPNGLAFDAGNQSLSGVSSQEGTIQLKVTDGVGASTSKSFEIKPRKACWLAYAAGPEGASQLKLYDPIRNEGLSSAPVNGGTVKDFKFSPNGQIMAYRVALPSGPSHLELLLAPSWSRAVVEGLGDVQHFTWSTDSKTLAVAYKTATETRLGGVNVASAHVAASDGGVPAIDDIRLLASASAPINSELTWTDSDSVAFTVDAPTAAAMVAYAPLTTAGFVSITKISTTDYSSAPLLRAGAGGVFASTQLGDLDFQPIPSTVGGLFGVYSSGVIDPAGRYVASAAGGNLQLLEASTTHMTFPFDVPFAETGHNCGLLLAWSPAQERFACVTNKASGGDGGQSGHGVIQIHNLSFAGGKPSFGDPSEVKGEYVYSEGLATDRRRVFSRSGDWLATVSSDGTSDTLYIIALRDGTPRVWATNRTFFVDGASNAARGELIFAPDEHALLWVGTQRVAAFDLHDATLFSVSISTVKPATPPVCSDDRLLTAQVWCGQPATPSQVQWSADSRWAAGVVANGAIKTWNVRADLITVERTPCDRDCGTQIAIQQQ